MKSDKSSKCMQANLRTQHLTININKQQLKGHKLKQYKPTLRIVHKCTRTQFLHAPWQARRLGPNSLARDAHFWRAVLVLPNMEVDSVAREIATFQRHARLLTTKGLHRFQRKDVWKLLQTPSSKAKTHHDNTNENPFMSKWIRGCTQQVRAGAADLLHQQYPSDRCSHDYSTPGRLSGYHELVFYGLWWISRTSIHGFINQPIVT